MPDIEIVENGDESISHVVFAKDETVSEKTSSYVGAAYDTLQSAVEGIYPVDRSVGLISEHRTKEASDARICVNSEQLRTFLKIDARAEGSYGAGSAKAKASYYNEQRKDYRSIVLGLSSTYRTHVLKLAENRLADDYIAQARGQSDEDVYKSWGDRFVHEVNLGGELLILLKTTFESEFERERFALSISAKYGTASGGIDISAGRDLIKTFQKAELKIEETGVRPGEKRDRDFFQYENAKGELITDVDKLLDYFESFQSRVFNSGVEEVILVKTRPVTRTSNWSNELPDLDLSAHFSSIVQMAQHLDELSEYRHTWKEINEHSERYIVEDHQALSDHSASLLGEIEEDETRIESNYKKLLASPFAEHHLEQPEFSKYEKTPARKPVSIPIIKGWFQQIKRDPASGSGILERSTQYKVAMDNPGAGKHWMPNHSGGRLEIRKFKVWVDPMPAGLGLTLRALFTNGHTIERVADPDAGVIDEGAFLKGIAFELEGPMRGAYFIEYQGHAGNKYGDTAIAGNTPASTLKAGEIVSNTWQLEGIRLAIWPKIPPTK